MCEATKAQTQAFVVYLFGPCPEGRFYVGQTQDFRRRINSHKAATGKCPKFHDAIHRFGWNAFPLQILAETHFQSEADRLEILYIAKHNSLWPSGYNMTLGGKATRFDPESKIVGFDEMQVSWDEILNEARYRLENKNFETCPACGLLFIQDYPRIGKFTADDFPKLLIDSEQECPRCGVSREFGLAVLSHLISGEDFESFIIPERGKLTTSFRHSRGSGYYVELMTSRFGRSKKIAEILPVAAVQYASQLRPYLLAALKHSVLMKLKEPSFALGRFIPYSGTNEELRVEIKVNRHLRSHHRELGTIAARHIEVFSAALLACSGREFTSRQLVEKLLLERGATQDELAEAGKDADLFQTVETIDENRLKSQHGTAAVRIDSPGQGVGFCIGLDISKHRQRDDEFRLASLLTFSAYEALPTILLRDDRLNEKQILSLSFDTHELRRQFVYEASEIADSERLNHLKRILNHGYSGMHVRSVEIPSVKQVDPIGEP